MKFTFKTYNFSINMKMCVQQYALVRGGFYFSLENLKMMQIPCQLGDISCRVSNNYFLHPLIIF